MKWFKHLAGSLNNSDIFEAIEKFGSDGYLVFFGTLELMADEFDTHNPGLCRISTKKLTKNLQLSRQKTVKILKFFHEKKRIFMQEEKDVLFLNCPRLAELTDEYTQKHIKKVSGQTPDSCRDKLRPKEEEGEVEEERDIIHSCPHKEIVQTYNEILGHVLPTVKFELWHGSSREKSLQARWKQDKKYQDMEFWKGYFTYIRDKCPFLTGENDKHWLPNLEWIIKKDKFISVLEGKYERR